MGEIVKSDECRVTPRVPRVPTGFLMESPEDPKEYLDDDDDETEICPSFFSSLGRRSGLFCL